MYVLEYHGYKAGDIVMLSDDSKNPRQLPTRRNIIDAMKWLVRSARTNDSLFFHCKFVLMSRIPQSPHINLQIPDMVGKRRTSVVMKLTAGMKV